MQFGKQFRGYNKSQVDKYIAQLEEEKQDLQDQVLRLQDDYNHLGEENASLQHKIEVQEETNEEIARIALKEASELIDKAKKNANMILTESLEYVRSLSDEMSDFKTQAIEFRALVEKMSKDLLETIDNSELYSLINEEEQKNYDEGDSL